MASPWPGRGSGIEGTPSTTVGIVVMSPTARPEAEPLLAAVDMALPWVEGDGIPAVPERAAAKADCWSAVRWEGASTGAGEARAKS